MNVAVVCLSQNNQMYELSEAMATHAHTNVIEKDSFNHREVIDLLVLGFDSSRFKRKKEVVSFIASLDRQHIHNIALFSLFRSSNKVMEAAVEACKNANLPLMREQYCCKLPLFFKDLPEEAKEGGRLYIQDMINIVMNYY